MKIWLTRLALGLVALVLLLIVGMVGTGFVLSRSHHPRFFAEIPPSPRLQIDDVTVVNPLNGSRTPGQSIVMERGRIITVMPTASMPDDPGVTHVKAAGTFAVPGFVNMHAHPLNFDDPSGPLAELLSEGVTGFRQMSGSDELLRRRREGKLSLGLDAPALLALPGPILTIFNAGSPQKVAKEIVRQKAEGADFVKMVLASPEVFYAALAAGRQVGIPVVGHLQPGTDAARASAEGFKSVEHLGPGDIIWTTCSSQEAALRADTSADPHLKAPPFNIPYAEDLMMPLLQRLLVNPAAYLGAKGAGRLQRALDTFDETKCRAYARQTVRDSTWQTPTLVRMRTQELMDDPAYVNDPGWKTMSPDRVKLFHQVFAKFESLPQSVRATFRQEYAQQLKLTKLFDEEGVHMLLGTDSAGTDPGQGFGQEVDQLADAGLSGLHILQMATVNAAEFLRRMSDMGTIAPGKLADVVLLDADPIADPRAMKRVHGVVRAGHYHSREDLDRLIQRVIDGHGSLRRD